MYKTYLNTITKYVMRIKIMKKVYQENINWNKIKIATFLWKIWGKIMDKTVKDESISGLLQTCVHLTL